MTKAAISRGCVRAFHRTRKATCRTRVFFQRQERTKSYCASCSQNFTWQLGKWMTNSNHFLYINIKYIHRSGSIVEWREKCHEFSGYRSSWRKSFWVWISALSFSMHGPCTSAQQMSWEYGPETPGEEPGKDCLGRCFSNSMWITVLKKFYIYFRLIII